MKIHTNTRVDSFFKLLGVIMDAEDISLKNSAYTKLVKDLRKNQSSYRYDTYILKDTDRTFDEFWAKNINASNVSDDPIKDEDKPLTTCPDCIILSDNQIQKCYKCWSE